MSLLKDMIFREIPVKDAYVKVSMPAVLPGNARMEFQISYSATAQSAPFLGETKDCEFILEGAGNIFEQAYAHLKALPEFADAADC